MEWLLIPVNKGKYKRNVFVSYLLLSFLLYNSFGTFLGKALHRLANMGENNITKYSNGNTALLFARDLQPQTPQTNVQCKNIF